MSGRKHIIIAKSGSKVLPFGSIKKLCENFGWNAQNFRNALSKAYKSTGKRIVEYKGWRIEKKPIGKKIYVIEK